MPKAKTVTATIRRHFTQGWGPSPDCFWDLEVNGELVEQDFDTEEAAVEAAKEKGALPKNIRIIDGGRPR